MYDADITLQRQCSMQDRRRSPRFDTWLHVRAHGELAGSYYGTLSSGGCDFNTQREYAVGQELDIGIALPGMGMGVAVSGVVLYRIRLDADGSRYRVAVVFRSTPFRAERFIARWLDHLAGIHPSFPSSVEH
jgi:hypothetical protein